MYIDNKNYIVFEGEQIKYRKVNTILKERKENIVHDLNDIMYISETVISRRSETEATLVYFLSGNNGDEFGQFPTFQQAFIKYQEIMTGRKIKGGD